MINWQKHVKDTGVVKTCLVIIILATTMTTTKKKNKCRNRMQTGREKSYRLLHMFLVTDVTFL